jgi:HK97 family phage major capsid protein/HK97 family phage prohead protease
MTHREAFETWRRDFPARLNQFEPREPAKGTTLRRVLTLDAKRAQPEQRSIACILSTETPVIRQGYREVLKHNDSAVDLSRADDGVLPLLWSHDPAQHLGSVRDIRIHDGKLRGTLHFAKGDFAEEKWQAVRDGHLRHVSVGYAVDDYDADRDSDLPLVNVTRWTLHEVSCVTVPADVGATIGRSMDAGLVTELPVDLELLRKEQALHSIWPQIEGIREHPQFARAFEELYRLAVKERFEEARELAGEIWQRAREAHDYTEADGTRRCAEQKYQDIITDDDHRLEWRQQSSDKDKGGSEMSNYAGFFVNKEVGERGLESFNLSRALAAQFDPASAQRAGFELEVMREASKARGKADGYAIPPQLLFTRDVTKGGTGSNLVGTDHLNNQYIDTLKSMMVSGRMGVTMLEGLVGDVSIPKGSSDSTAGWIAGDGSDDVSESDPGFTAVTLSPKTVGAYTSYSRKMLLQALPQADMLLRRSLAYSVAKAIDTAVLNGSGLSNQPLGIIGQSDVATPTYANGGSPSFNDLVDLEGELMADDAPLSSLGYVTTGSLASVLKKTQVVSGQDRMVWETTEAGEGRVNGYRAVHSSICPDGHVIFGNWSECLLGMWGGLDINVDPYTQSTAGTVRIIIFQDVDVAVRHGESFAVLSEAAPE